MWKENFCRFWCDLSFLEILFDEIWRFFIFLKKIILLILFVHSMMQVKFNSFLFTYNFFQHFCEASKNVKICKIKIWKTWFCMKIGQKSKFTRRAWFFTFLQPWQKRLRIVMLLMFGGAIVYGFGHGMLLLCALAIMNLKNRKNRARKLNFVYFSYKNTFFRFHFCKIWRFFKNVFFWLSDFMNCKILKMSKFWFRPS